MAEKRLIDANALTEKVKGICEDSFAFRCSQHSREFAKDIADAVKKAPTVDAVEVVRCCLCKHWDVDRLYCHHPAGLSFCGKTGAAKGFCCFGERRTDG